jgi:phosphoribosylamine--glycine ligase
VELLPGIRATVFEPLLKELKKRGIVYKGVIYAGLMLTKDGPKVLEFNCRFGDPETQAIIPRISGDLLPALEACVDGGLVESMIKWDGRHCICVVMASGGYPGAYSKGKVITGLESVKDVCDVIVFHAGTGIADAKVVTSGGRALGVVGLGNDLRLAVKKAYSAVSKIVFDGVHYRNDIGRRALKREKG